MPDRKLQSYLDQYGPTAGPKLYHAVQSRAAYIGATNRLRRVLAGLPGSRRRVRNDASPAQPMLFEVAGSEGGSAA